MKILIVEPYLAGSHAAWAREYAAASSHDVEILSLPGRHWKWRMHGGAVTLARRFLEARRRPDLVLTTDMLDLTTFLALTRRVSGGASAPAAATAPAAIYFHENQLSYPWSSQDDDPALGRDAHYGFINYVSALAADAVLFNSRYHMESFLRALPEFLAVFPDHNEPESVGAIAAKSSVLPLGLDLAALERYRESGVRHGGDQGGHRESGDMHGGARGVNRKRDDLPCVALGHRLDRNPQAPPLVLWNHRWEYDKNPDDFFRALFVLADEGLLFEVAVLGEAFERRPPVFDQARERLGARIARFGFVEDPADYARWLWRADILPVTSNHDFFGASTVQAIYCGCRPLLPRRFAFPEHIPEEYHGECLYDGFEDLVSRLRAQLSAPREPAAPISFSGALRQPAPPALRAHVARYDWSVMAPRYDRIAATVIGRQA